MWGYTKDKVWESGNKWRGKGCGSIRNTEIEIECSEVHDDGKYTAGNNYDKGNSKLKLNKLIRW